MDVRHVARFALVPVWALVPALVAGCAPEGEQPPSGLETNVRAPAALVVGMPDVADARGLHYANISGQASKPTILDAGGAGVALLDLAEDGDLDAVFAQGLESLETFVRGPGVDVQTGCSTPTGPARSSAAASASWC